MSTIGINGFGRIGRTAFRVWLKKHSDRSQLAMINTSGSMDIAGCAYLLKYDSNYGTLDDEVNFEEVQKAKDATKENPLLGFLLVRDFKIPVTAGRDPSVLPWGQYGVETVIESTGAFVDPAKAATHLQGGAKRVIISAPH